MEIVYTNWDTDWSSCESARPKPSMMRWCPNCHEYHDKGCFFHFKGHTIGCMISKASRGKAMGKIKGGTGK